MRYKQLGRTGLKISVVGLGTWQLGSPAWNQGRPKPNLRVIEKALENGINLFDTAEVYGNGLSERVLGEALGKRDDVVVVTKIAWFRTDVDDILKAAHNSKRRLRRDAIDLLLYHWPPVFYARICRIINALEKTVDMGYAAHIGLSNFPAELLEKALSCLKKHNIVANQVQYNLAFRTPELNLKPLMDRSGIEMLAWSPLAKGALAGKRDADNWARKIDKVFRKAAKDYELQSALKKAASSKASSMAQVALAWLIFKGAVPIPGARKINHVEDLAKAADIRLSEEEARLLDKVSQKYVTMWGSRYPLPLYMRALPPAILKVIINMMGGA